MPKYFLGKRILVVTAHPDDEGIAAGTMYENYKAGGETFLICATYGEKGKAHLDRPVSDAALKRIRKNELLKAAKILHIKKVFFLGMPDTGVRENKKKMFQKTLAIAKKIKPEQILSFGPDGMSGHLDHIATGEVALEVAKKLQIPLAAFTAAFGLNTVRQKMIRARRRFGKYAEITKRRKGDIKIKIEPTIKRKAMSNHKSQFPTGTPFPTMPKVILKKWLSAEYFVTEKI
jgi:LmbE family N-acetylglucosaminyl deacetylase